MHEGPGNSSRAPTKIGFLMQSEDLRRAQAQCGIKNPFHCLSVAKEHNPVVNRGDNPAADIADDKRVGRAQKAATESNSITRKVLAQELEMGTDIAASLQNQDVRCAKDTGGREDAQSESEDVAA